MEGTGTSEEQHSGFGFGREDTKNVARHGAWQEHVFGQHMTLLVKLIRCR